MGHTVGPFKFPPFKNFVVSSLGVRAKKSGGHRVILDLSRPFGHGINGNINRDMYSLFLCSIDDAVRLVTAAGVGALMAKQDIRHAFRLIPVRPADWHLVGYKIKNLEYFDVVLPFGCRSSPFLFGLLSEAVHWIVADQSQCQTILHYVDDFFIVDRPNSKECEAVVNLMVSFARSLVYPSLWKKPKGRLLLSHSLEYKLIPLIRLLACRMVSYPKFLNSYIRGPAQAENLLSNGATESYWKSSVRLKMCPCSTAIHPTYDFPFINIF